MDKLEYAGLEEQNQREYESEASAPSVVQETEKARSEDFAFSDTLLRWYEVQRRILPWREKPTPYHVWLSEIMLQQTRVEAVKGYYDRFLAHLPTIEALAEAPEDVYLKLWEGLGYYSRVRNLHQGAVQLREEYAGRLPRSSEELRRIAGIGPYTAAAVASIAFGERIPAVDGNLLRIFSRLTAYEQSIKTERAKRRATEYFIERMPAERPWEMLGEAAVYPRYIRENPCGAFNQALMDLGATVCLPNGQPSCGSCPLSAICAAHALHRELQYPIRDEKKPRKQEDRTVLLVRSGQSVLIRKRPGRGLLAGLYEFPNLSEHLPEAEVRGWAEAHGFQVRELKKLPEAKHIFTHIQWNMIGYELWVEETEAVRDFVRISELRESYSIPSAFSAYVRFL